MNIDDQLKKRLEFEFDSEPQIDSSHIDVEVKDRIVTVSGYLYSRYQRDLSATIANRLRGVRAIVDKLEVRLPGSASHIEEEIAAGSV